MHVTHFFSISGGAQIYINLTAVVSETFVEKIPTW